MNKTKQKPAIVITSGGKAWMAFYPDALPDGTWILRAELVSDAQVDLDEPDTAPPEERGPEEKQDLSIDTAGAADSLTISPN